MNIRVLNAFLTVCKLGNITKASEVLHITQPALSRQIQDLEEFYGCKLFNRSKRQITLTPQGYLLQLRAQELVNLSERTRKELSQTEPELRGIVKIGCVETLVTEFVTQKISDWKAQYPHVLFELYSADGDDIKRQLDEDKLDIGFCLTPIEIAKYESMNLTVEDRWGVVVQETDENRTIDIIHRSEVPVMPLILPRRTLVIDNLSEWLGVPVSDLNIAGYHNIPTNALCFVKKGIGALLCVEGSYTIRPVEGLKFIPIEPLRTVSHCVIRKMNRQLSQAAESFWAQFDEASGN